MYFCFKPVKPQNRHPLPVYDLFCTEALLIACLILIKRPDLTDFFSHLLIFFITSNKSFYVSNLANLNFMFLLMLHLERPMCLEGYVISKPDANTN